MSEPNRTLNDATDQVMGAVMAAAPGDDMDEESTRDAALRTAVGSTIDKLADEKHVKQFFCDPVPRSVTGYHDVIERPICLADIRGKLSSDTYKSKPMDFVSDVDLMFNNCIEYNSGKDSDWLVGVAKRLRLRFYAIIRQHDQFSDRPPSECTRDDMMEMLPDADVPAPGKRSSPDDVAPAHEPNKRGPAAAKPPPLLDGEDVPSEDDIGSLPPCVTDIDCLPVMNPDDDS